MNLNFSGTERLSRSAVDGLYRYELAFIPERSGLERLDEERKRFEVDYNQPSDESNPHITLARFVAREDMEQTLIRWMERICRMMPVFNVTLNNYSALPPHTIYLRVQDQIPFNRLANWMEPLDSFLQSSSCPPIELSNKHFVTIANRLTEEIYTQAIADYAQRTFHESFMVEELQLLRRCRKTGTSKTINIFRLMPN